MPSTFHVELPQENGLSRALDDSDKKGAIKP